MPGEVFYWVFNMSIAATICMLPILLIRCVRSIPRRVFVWLWIIPFLRLCLPVGLSSPYSLMTLISHFTTRTVTVYEMGSSTNLTMTNYVMGANQYFPITYKVRLLENLFNTVSIIWFIIVVAALLAMIGIYGITGRQVKSAKNVRNNIYMSNQIESPGVYGVFKAKILLPEAYPEEALPYVLMHEQAHVQRKDNLVRLLAFVIVCVHWFNPFAWLMLKLLYSDMELACDETVLAKCNEAQHKEYARALLCAVERTYVFSASFGGAKIRMRIENILSYKKISVFAAIAFSLLILASACVLLTNAS